MSSSKVADRKLFVFSENRLNISLAKLKVRNNNIVFLLDKKEIYLKNKNQFIGFNGEKEKLTSILIKNNDDDWKYWINKIFTSSSKFEYLEKNARKTAMNFTWKKRSKFTLHPNLILKALLKMVKHLKKTH